MHAGQLQRISQPCCLSCSQAAIRQLCIHAAARQHALQHEGGRRWEAGRGDLLAVPADVPVPR
jgi:hypothetical protein